MTSRIYDETSLAWCVIAPTVADHQWHGEMELNAEMVAAGMSDPDRMDFFWAARIGHTPLEEVWEGKASRPQYRLTPPGELHVRWRWNSGERQEREARQAAARG